MNRMLLSLFIIYAEFGFSYTRVPFGSTLYVKTPCHAFEIFFLPACLFSSIKHILNCQVEGDTKMDKFRHAVFSRQYLASRGCQVVRILTKKLKVTATEKPKSQSRIFFKFGSKKWKSL